MIARRIFVEGRVQGVFFREWTLKRARELGVTGWVRNRHDGRVEIYAVGDAAMVARLIERASEGPPASCVEKVEVEEAEVEQADGFSRRQTG